MARRASTPFRAGLSGAALTHLRAAGRRRGQALAAPTSSSSMSGTIRRSSRALGRLRARGGRFTLLFHDTHHRAVTAPRRDARLRPRRATTACSPSARRWRDVYRALGLGRPRVRLARGRRHAPFHPPAQESAREGLVWIGNWGDGERSDGARRASCCEPAHDAGLAARHLRRALSRRGAARRSQRYGARYRGWLAECRARRTCSRGILRPCTCRAASTSRRCPASRPSACSRRWPAASRWCPRRGTIASICSAPARTS